MKMLKIQTKKKREVVDITDLVESGLQNDSNLVNLFVKHTTAALTVADLDPGTDLDMLDAFEAMIPAHSGEARPDQSGRPKLNYRHPHDPSHVPDHILSALVGVSLTLPVRDGKLDLGAWQRVVLVEFDGPRTREVVIF